MKEIKQKLNTQFEELAYWRERNESYWLHSSRPFVLMCQAVDGFIQQLSINFLGGWM